MVVAASDYPFLNLMWTMIVFFGWVIWIWLLITAFADLFRRPDLSGWGKTGWTIAFLIVPFLGVLIYLISQGRGMAERQASDSAAAQAQFESYIRSVSATSETTSADQIARAKQLFDSGTISREEFEVLKQQALHPAAPYGASSRS